MSKTFKPMLAVNAEDIEKINYPVFASPKLDGIRCLVIGNELLSRKLKPIPNGHCQSLFANHILAGFDGELIVGEPNASDAYNKTTSGVMSQDGEPDVYYYVFDLMEVGWPYIERYAFIKNHVKALPKELRERIRVVEQVRINDADELRAYEEKCVNEGYEGIMIRDIHGNYKFGRSTLREGLLLKVKRFEDMEATIVGFEERMSNQNEAKRNALGQIERSTAKDGKVATDSLGALVCRADGYEQTFNVGSGFTEEQRQKLWEQRDELIGKLAKIKYQPAGEKDAPRFPVFIGFRSEIDL